MFNFHKDHKNLVNTVFVIFVILSIGIAVMPAYQMQKDLAPLPNDKELTQKAYKGLNTYISEGCVACHTQQVRNIEMDESWGNRPSIPSDYYYSKQRQDVWRQTPSLLGSERTGPDLTNVGIRQPSLEWHLLHLYNPRSVVEASIMPAYPWLFNEKDSANENDVVINVPIEFAKDTSRVIVASEKALELVAYLQSLKQADLQNIPSPDFIASRKKKNGKPEGSQNTLSPKIDGASLYANTCASCHQSNGKGLKGAFPPLAGSPVVNDSDPELMVQIILYGYDARTEYASMPAFKDQLSDEEIAAIVNHERRSWGNNAPEITAETVTEIRKSANIINQ